MTSANEGQAPWLSPSLGLVDGPTLALTASALHLVPSNCEKTLRLNRAAAIGLALPVAMGASPLSPSRTRKILNDAVFSDPSILSQEDPKEEPLIQYANFAGRSFRVAPNLDELSVWQLNALLDVIFSVEFEAEKAFQNYCTRISKLLLSLSEHVLDGAALRPEDSDPVSGARQQITIPQRTELDRLRRLVTFAYSVVSHDFGNDLVDTFIARPEDSANLFKESPVAEQITNRPFVRVDDLLILAAPLDLAACLRNALIRASYEFGLHSAVERALARSISELLRNDFKRNGFSLVTAEIVEPSGTCQQRLRVDDQNFIELSVAVDLPANPGSHTGLANKGSIFEAIMQVKGADYQADQEVVFVLVVEAFGSDVFHGTSNRALPQYATNTLDLQVLLNAHRHPLTLSRYIAALDNLPEETRTFSFSPLDQFSLYRDHGDSFYLGDEGTPTGILVEPGYATEMRLDYFDRNEVHYVERPLSSVPSPAIPRHGRRVAPIYASRDGFDVIELVGRTIFVVPTTDDDDDLVEASVAACSYWVWQILRHADEAASVQSASLRSVEVEIQKSEEAFTCHATAIGSDSVLVQLLGDIEPWIERRDNSLDRELVRALAAVLVPRTLPDDIVEAVAPLGLKKMITAIPQNDVPSWPRAVPAVRYVEDAVVADLLDDMGKWLREVKGHTEGVIARDQRVKVLNDVVGYYFNRLNRELSSLAPAELLEQLIDRDEALIVEDRARGRNAPTKLACFDLPAKKRREIIDGQRALALSSISSRFLVEHVAAKPTTGTDALDLRRYEYVLALSSEIVNKGMLSDAIRYELASPNLSILPSGRLGIERGGRYEKAMDTHGAKVSLSLVNAAISAAVAPRVAEDEKGDPDPALVEAFEEEFGFPITDFPVATIELVKTQWPPTDRSATSMSLDDAVSVLRAEVGWTEETCVAFVEALSLKPRDQFLPSGDKSAVYPWRFNRDLSYARRPIIVRVAEDSQKELVWGPRRLYDVGHYLLELIESARIDAKKLALQRVVSLRKNQVTAAFNDSVAQTLRTETRCTVYVRVDKVGRLRVAGRDGQTLGDIDVLCIDGRSRTIWAFEAKDFSAARTPFELSNEVEKIFTGAKPTMLLHARRVEWVQNNLSAFLDFYVPDLPKGGWSVQGAVVVSQTLAAPLLRDSHFPVLTVAESVVAVRQGENQKRRKKR